MLAVGLVFVEQMAASDLVFGRNEIRFDAHVKKLAVALPFFFLGLLVRPRWVRRHAALVYGTTMVLLILVPLVGEARNGARRWIQLPAGFDLQPSELAKLGLILALARSLYRNRLEEARDWLVPAGLALLPMALVVAQPDLGTAMSVVPVFLGMCWIAGARGRVLTGLVLAGALAGGLAWKYEWIHGYQKKRIDTWAACFDNDALIENRNGAAFHPYHARVPIGNGGFLGTGLGEGVANQAGHLPERNCDSIFAVIAEEGGFAGASLFVVAYLSFAGLLLAAAGATRERFSRLVIAGVGLYFAAHFLINSSVNLGLVPMTGLTLPLVSTGGSSLLASLACLGLALGLSARAEPALDSDSFRG
jgi:rod shape determining protein RodA